MADTSHILIVDDDSEIRKVLTLLLKDKFIVHQAADGREAIDLVPKLPNLDLIIMDVMLPGISGFAACAEIRRLSNAPVLFLTAKSAEADKLEAYAHGGDDFISKPFSQAELMAKINSLLRRYREYKGKPETLLTLFNLEVDPVTHSIKSFGKELFLTDTERSIFDHLLKRRGETVTTAELYETVWGERFLSSSGNTVMVHVLNLRRKIEEDPASPKIIRTVWGKGYRID